MIDPVSLSTLVDSSEPVESGEVFISLRLAQGRRGPLWLAEDGRRSVAVKAFPQRFARGPPPPAHPHVNRVCRRLSRLILGEVHTLEVRLLCDGGELFDGLQDRYGSQPPPPEVAARFFSQIASGVEHCHHHGAAVNFAVFLDPCAHVLQMPRAT